MSNQTQTPETTTERTESGFAYDHDQYAAEFEKYKDSMHMKKEKADLVLAFLSDIGPTVEATLSRYIRPVTKKRGQDDYYEIDMIDGQRVADQYREDFPVSLLEPGQTVERRIVHYCLLGFRMIATGLATANGHPCETPIHTSAAIATHRAKVGVPEKVYWPPVKKEIPAGILAAIQRYNSNH